MQPLKQQLKPYAALVLAMVIAAPQTVMAETDMQQQEKVLRAREMNAQQQAGHADHKAPTDASQEFRGVFYGYLPCDDCNGIKTTLSLKQKNNYLLVTQPARESSREYYEKGKYHWDEENKVVVLTPRKGGTAVRKYQIDNDSTLIQLNGDGSAISDGAESRYTLRRSDTYKSREVHIH